MHLHPIVITSLDRLRLNRVLASAFAQAIEPQSHLRELEFELERAEIVDSGCAPADAVTMNSMVELTDLSSGTCETFTLVYPDRARIAGGQLSILAPIGTAILGHRVGDIVCSNVSGTVRRLRIERVLFQPEREALFQL